MTGSERLEHLARTVGPDVLAYLVRRTSPVEDAADVYAEVLTVTWRKLPAVPRDDREAFAWMLGVARRCLSNQRRSSSRRAALGQRLRAELVTATTRPDRAAALDADRALLLLSTEDRELVTLVYWEQLTTVEAAGVIGISHAAARKRLERARATLREALVVCDR